MNKWFASILTVIGLKAASIATAACFFIIFEEPTMPNSLIKK